jgi:C-terminal processing protease CtpA/Prc
MRRSAATAVLAGLLAGAGAQAGAQDGPRPADRQRARVMLKTIHKELQKSYYDPTFHGVDLDAHHTAAEKKIEAAGSVGQLMGIVAQFVMELDDSHTRFLPPRTTVSVDYGWEIRMVGERCLVVDVEPGSDAAAQGVKPGDVVLEAQGAQPTRDNLWKFHYLYGTLRPQPGLTAVLQAPGQSPRRVQFRATVKEDKRVLDFTEGEDLWNVIRRQENEATRHVSQLVGEVEVWRMPAFDLEKGQVDKMLEPARKGRALVLDLRGNPGGRVDMLEALVSALFDREVKIAEVKGRKESRPLMGRPRDTPVKGTLVVLVDSGSASAAEVLARLVQIEKRGVVVGDRTRGAVMRSRVHPFHLGLDRIVPYAVTITDADLVMTDGKSLEKAGVTPDVTLLPTPEDLAAGRDPVLAHAVGLAGARISAVAAGRLFPRPQ